MNSVLEFLAHAVVLEEEAADRYDELATAMTADHNEPVATLFREMSRVTRIHLSEMVGRARKAGDLPDLKPWEYKWPGGESPGARGLDQESDHTLTPNDALRLALTAEQMVFAFYAKVAATSEVPEVRKLAQTFADEETGHVTEIERWLERYPEADTDWNKSTRTPG